MSRAAPIGALFNYERITEDTGTRGKGRLKQPENDYWQVPAKIRNEKIDKIWQKGTAFSFFKIEQSYLFQAVTEIIGIGIKLAGHNPY